MTPFLVVTPLGLLRAEALATALHRLGIGIDARLTLWPWAEAASRLYQRELSPAAIARAARFEQRWRSLCPADRAQCWRLADATDFPRLLQAKAALRQRFGGVPLGPAAPGEPAFRLHAFHVPDAEAVAAEAGRLREFLAAG
jgi:hypothetical protein